MPGSCCWMKERCLAMQRPVDSSWAIMSCICLGVFCLLFFLVFWSLMWFSKPNNRETTFKTKQNPLQGRYGGPHAPPSPNSMHSTGTTSLDGSDAGLASLPLLPPLHMPSQPMLDKQRVSLIAHVHLRLSALPQPYCSNPVGPLPWQASASAKTSPSTCRVPQVP